MAIEFPKKQEQRLIPKYLLDYLGEVNELHPDPSDLGKVEFIDITWNQDRITSEEYAKLGVKTIIRRYADGWDEYEYYYYAGETKYSIKYTSAIPEGSDSGENIGRLTLTFITIDKEQVVPQYHYLRRGYSYYWIPVPTVNNNTITLTQGGATKGTFTLNQSSDQTIDLNDGIIYEAGTGIDITNDTISVDNTVAMKTDIPTNYVTTDTTQNITGEKTFIGEKRIKLKQSNSLNKPGFTIYDNSNNEKGYLEYNPTDSGLYLGRYGNSGVTELGFLSQLPESTNIKHKVLIPNTYRNGNTTDYLVTSINNTRADASGNVTINIPDTNNMVTTNTAQNITEVKTFLGNKKLAFKQSASNDVLGFTAYDLNNKEYGNLQINSRSMKINNVTSTKDFVSLGNYKESSISGARAEVGVRVQADKTGSASPASKNYIYPRNFANLPSTSDTFYIPLCVNGNYADDAGNISLTIPTVPTNVSDFTNDAGYITQQALVGLATETYVDDAIDDLTIPSTATSTSTVTPTTITLTFTYSDNTTENVTLMTGASVSTTTTLS